MSSPSPSANPFPGPMLAPSLLSADFARLAEDIAVVETGGADYLHVDVMDGHFVPNLTIGPPVVKAIKKVAKAPLDVHLMITDPADYLDAFLDAGSNILTFHVEAVEDPRALIARIRERGAKAGMAISPPTPFERIEPYVGDLDLLLVMSVNPGFGGQSFMPEVLEKVRRARELGGSDLIIEIDGGINRETIAEAASAGVDLFVAGSAVFRASDPQAEVGVLRSLAYNAVSRSK